MATRKENNLPIRLWFYWILYSTFFGPTFESTLSSWHAGKRRERKQKKKKKKKFIFSAKTSAALRPERTEAEGAPRQKRSSYVDILLAPCSGAGERERERRSRRWGRAKQEGEKVDKDKKESVRSEGRKRWVIHFILYTYLNIVSLYAYSNVDTPSLTCREVLLRWRRERKETVGHACTICTYCTAPLPSATSSRRLREILFSHTLEKKGKQNESKMKMKIGTTRNGKVLRHPDEAITFRELSSPLPRLSCVPRLVNN